MEIYVKPALRPETHIEIRSRGSHSLLAIADEQGVYLFDRRDRQQYLIPRSVLIQLCGLPAEAIKSA